MKEGDCFEKMDRYFRREDTLLSQACKKISPTEGSCFRQEQPVSKRAVDIMIATPTAVATLPIVGILAAAAKLEDGGPSFYLQKRVGQNGEPFEMVKVRCMKVDADKDTEGEMRNVELYEAENDPRNTRLGKITRKYELEELPQLWQVVKGDLSLVDIRAANQNTHNYIEKKNPINAKKWKEEYYRGKPGLFSLNSAVNPKRKDNTKRIHYDLLYARRASLGLNLYILWRTGVRALRSLNKNE